MKTFNDFSGVEGIDKLMECAPYVGELLSDKKNLSRMSEMTWIELGATMYKAHTEACDKLFAALDEKPDTSLGLVSATAQIMSEIFGNKDMIDFFISAGKAKKSSGSVTENSEGEQ